MWLHDLEKTHIGPGGLSRHQAEIPSEYTVLGCDIAGILEAWETSTSDLSGEVERGSKGFIVFRTVY